LASFIGMTAARRALCMGLGAGEALLFWSIWRLGRPARARATTART
jgi:hypothetical protein